MRDGLAVLLMCIVCLLLCARVHDGQNDIESAAWSPDGKSVLYSLENGDIDVIRADGSGAHRLITMKMLIAKVATFRALFLST